MGDRLARFYMAVREPNLFFKIVAAFIILSLTAHFLYKYDVDLGLTNLILSIEATLYGIVSSMMVKTVMKNQKEAAELQRRQLEYLIEMVQAQRDMMADNKNRDEKILQLLLAKQGVNHDA